MPLIAMAHRIPYVATPSVAELRDFEEKVSKAVATRGGEITCTFTYPVRSAGAVHHAIRSASPPVTTAVGHGKKAVRCIDAYLRGTEYVPEPKHPLASFDRLNTYYCCDAPATVQPELDFVRRQSTFSEVRSGLDESNALFEARRCLNCGNCFERDNCYGVCPDNAIIKKGGSGRAVFEINYDYCKGCGLCGRVCMRLY